MNHLMKNPPKQVLPDGTIQEWRGMPGLIDVTQTIAVMREERAFNHRLQEGERVASEMRRLEQRRKEHPEEFITWREVCERAAKENPKIAALMNMAATHGMTEEELEAKKRESEAVAARYAK